MALGSPTVKSSVNVQPFTSVIFTVYVPGCNVNWFCEVKFIFTDVVVSQENE